MQHFAFKVKVVIQKTVKVVDSFAFSFNDNIYELEIADGVKVLESDAFTSMTNLKSVTVPDSVKEMDNCGLGMDVADNYDSVPLKALKCIAKKVQPQKHMQKKTICHMR